MPTSKVRLGIDLGGTKIEIVALDAAGRVLLRRRAPTPQNDYQATLRAVADLVRIAEGELGTATHVGVGRRDRCHRTAG